MVQLSYCKYNLGSPTQGLMSKTSVFSTPSGSDHGPWMDHWSSYNSCCTVTQWKKMKYNVRDDFKFSLYTLYWFKLLILQL